MKKQLGPLRSQGAAQRGNIRIFGTVLFVVVTIAMSVLLLRLPEKKNGKIADLPFTPAERVATQPQEVLGASDLPAGKIVLAQRSVVAIDGQGNNAYQYAFFLSDFTGQHRFTFAKRDDLLYEAMQVVGGAYLAVYDDSGVGTKDVFRFDGQDPSSTFVPPYQPEGALFSEDGSQMAYVESDEIGDMTVIVRNMSTNEVEEYASSAFSTDPDASLLLQPLAFSMDNQELYIEAMQDIGLTTSPYVLYRVQLSDASVTTVFQQGEDEVNTHFKQLVGLFSDMNMALFESLDYGAASTAIDNVNVKTTFTTLDLTTLEQNEWFQYENVASPLAHQYASLSPDRQWLALESLDQTNPGVLLWNTEDKSFRRLTATGSFLAWSPDSRFVLTEQVTFDNSGAYTLSSIDLQSGKEYVIFQQSDLSEGTGLNQIGDSFSLFLGIASDLSTI
ncbi:MAG: hypothetical protein H6760_01075 [Candidatus Nomurabacteria bacterium]|nr:MAG: hypothetical protein H6760_01075 [Candidatus Nomurabacteria bacterium]